MYAERILWTALFVALGSCAPSSRVGLPGAADELSGRQAGAERQCVPVIAGENLRFIDERTLALGHGQTIMVNHLRDACASVARATTLVSEIRGGEYCRGDVIRGFEPGDVAPGPACILGNWTPYRRP